MDRVLVHWVALLVARCFPKEERGWSSELCNCGQQQSPIFRFVSVYQKKQKQKGKDHLITTRTEKNQVLPRAHALRYAIAVWEWLPGVCLLGWWVRPGKGAWFGPWGQRLKPTATLARTWVRECSHVIAALTLRAGGRCLAVHRSTSPYTCGIYRYLPALLCAQSQNRSGYSLQVKSKKK